MSQIKKQQILENYKDNKKLLEIINEANNIEKSDYKIFKKMILSKINRKTQKHLLPYLLSAFLESNDSDLNRISSKFRTLIENKNSKNTNKPSVKNELLAEMYINIGRDKKIYPNTLVQFIQNSMNIDSEEIKNIRIFDKYSFFQVPKDLGEKAILLLSVKRFRGKKIIVNYSKQKHNS